MANRCLFKLKAFGKKRNVGNFKIAFQNNGDRFGYKRFARIYHAEILEEHFEEEESYIIFEGECAWSVLVAMRNWKNSDPMVTSLEEESKNLSLDIEVFSEELGMGFQEHFLIKSGVINKDDLVECFEVSLEDFEDQDENLIEVSEDDLKNGWVKFGGLDNWGEFSI